MTALLTSLLTVTLLLDPPTETPVAPVATTVKPVASSAKQEVTSARITSRTSDFDMKAGVVMFEGDVCVRYSEDFVMCADKLYIFLAGTNELSRAVAVGAVSITNENRVGTCAMATYRRQRGEIEMFGDGKKSLASLSDGRGGARSLEGLRIRFWLGSEQAEVEKPRITADGNGGAKLL